MTSIPNEQNVERSRFQFGLFFVRNWDVGTKAWFIEEETDGARGTNHPEAAENLGKRLRGFRSQAFELEANLHRTCIAAGINSKKELMIALRENEGEQWSPEIEEFTRELLAANFDAEVDRSIDLLRSLYERNGRDWDPEEALQFVPIAEVI